MTLNDALEHVNVHSEDTFKVTPEGTFNVTVGDWLGDLYSNRVATTSGIQRFSATSLKFKTVIVGNRNVSNNAYIGKYYSDVNTFIDKALVIWEKSNMTFEYVDIYNLAYRSKTGAQYLQIIGINEY